MDAVRHLIAIMFLSRATFLGLSVETSVASVAGSSVSLVRSMAGAKFLIGA
jgi:hypothetical protein